MKIRQEDKNRLGEILAIQAANAQPNPNDFFKGLVQEADLPENWKREKSGVWTGNPNIDSLKLIDWALSKRVNPNNNKFTTLGSIIYVFMNYLGYDERCEIAQIIINNNLVLENKSLEEIKNKFDLSSEIFDVYPAQYIIVEKEKSTNLKQFILNINVCKSTGISLGVTVLIGLLRFSGLMQASELEAYDLLMQYRLPLENWDDRIVVIGVTANDLKQFETSELPDKKLHDILIKLKKDYKPKVIGIDIYRDIPQRQNDDDSQVSDKESQELHKYITNNQDIIPVCKSESASYPGAKIFDNIELERFGFGDIVFDDLTQETVRRHLLSIKPIYPVINEKNICKTQYSFSYQLAVKYLEFKGYEPFWEKDYLYFSNKKYERKTFPIPFEPIGVSWWSDKDRAGGYQKIDEKGGYDPSGYQLLLNYRRGQVIPISIGAILTLNNDSDLKNKIKDKIVLIGYTDQENNKDLHFTPITKSPDNKMSGVVLQAHMVSQIISAVLDGRKLLYYWSFEVEILWIWVWSLMGGIGVILVWQRTHNLLWLVLVVTILLVLFAVCYLLFMQAIWVPLIPTALALVGTSGIIIGINLWQMRN